IGRTGRAGATGQAVSFCSPDELEFLRDIEKLIGREIPLNSTQEWHLEHLKRLALHARSTIVNPTFGSSRGGSRRRGGNNRSRGRRHAHA
ncbi:MAG TPA: hypothetical protein VFY13_00220, partial [Luteolibacter sp.]|nr:hypothetical protein [Luteolibacter sp.]